MTFEDVTDFNIDDSENPLIPPDSPFLAKKVEAAYDKNDIDIQDFPEDFSTEFIQPVFTETTEITKEKKEITGEKKEIPPAHESSEISFSTEEEIDLDDFLSGGGELGWKYLPKRN